MAVGDGVQGVAAGGVDGGRADEQAGGGGSARHGVEYSKKAAVRGWWKAGLPLWGKVSSNSGMQWMRVLGRLGLVGAGVGLMLAAQGARAQGGGCTFTDDNGKTVFWPNCQPPAGAKSADGKDAPPNGNAPANAPVPAPGSSPAKSFPFPGDTPAATPGSSPSAGASGAPAADKFPFPGDDSTKSAAQPGDSSGGPMKDAGSSGSSSSSSSSGSDGDDSAAGPLGDDADTDPAAKAAEARRAERLKKERGISFHQTPDERETEALKIASFYQSDGN